jgi:N-ethylmaleimide reductase
VKFRASTVHIISYTFYPFTLVKPMNTNIDLFSPVRLGRYELPNRMVMAPLTRNRAGEGNVPRELNTEYYAQRVSAGLIITEATQVSPQGLGYPFTPGIHSQEQVEGWRLVTKAVHDRGGKIFLQLWHVGRISHPDLQVDGALPVAPSAIAPSEGMAATYEGEKPYVTPRALETAEIPGIVEQYRQGAKNALAAGFDGVEIHSANGYLLDQFLHDGSNHRTDEYGGSIENRARLLMEVTEAVVSVWGADRVGVRLSPSGTFGSVYDSDLKALFTYVVDALNQFELAYLHLVEPRVAGNETVENPTSELSSKYFRPIYKGTLISAGGYDRESGNAVLASGDADLVAYGRLFISNPDLPQRFALNAQLNPYDRSSFYGGDKRGYTDYPSLELQAAG